MKKLIWSFFVSLFYAVVLAQTASVSGIIKNSQEAPTEYVNVTLHQALDSTLVGFAVTGPEGHFEIRELPADSFFLIASYIGFSDYYSEIFTLEEQQDYKMPPISLSLAINQLTEVEVKARRPLIELKPGKMIFNVASSINASSGTAFDLLRRAPGVIVTNQDVIMLLGQSGVQIYINDKPSPFGGADVIAYLRTIQASEIEAIEIISNPSARYDAEGNAGIINIRLKKPKSHGLNTNLNLAYSGGEKAWYDAGLNTNYRNKHFNLFGRYSMNIGESTSSTQIISQQEELVFDQSTQAVSDWNTQKLKVGLDIYPSEQQTIGFEFDGTFNDYNWDNNIRSPVYRIGNQEFDSIFISKFQIEGLKQNFKYNVNYRYNEADGSTFLLNADYIIWSNQVIGQQPNLIFDGSEEFILDQRDYTFKNPQNIKVFTLQADLENSLEKGQFITGVKTTFSNTENGFEFYRMSGSKAVLDDDRTNDFSYTERVLAGYIQYSSDYQKLNFQIGLRAENTFSIGELVSKKPTEEDDVGRRYLDLFPSAGLSYQMNPKNSFQLNYSRRINRPSYSDLNPFEFQKDEVNVERGNPFLKPEYTQKVQLTHSYNYQFFTSFYFSKTKDQVVSVRDTFNHNQLLRQWVNLAEQVNIGGNISFSRQFLDWWYSYNSLSAYRIQNLADYGPNKQIDVSTNAFNIYSQQIFFLPHSFSIELSGWYNSAAIWGANFESDPIWNIDFGLQKKLWNDRAKINLTISDIFRSSGWFGTSQFNGLTVSSSGYSDNRRLSVYLSYLFGNQNVKGKKRKSSVVEESKRIETNGIDRG